MPRQCPAGHPQLPEPPPEGRRRTGPITFESIRPQVRFVGRGLILPRRDRLTVPIEAVNLKSLQVAAFQIYPGQHGPVLPGQQPRGVRRVGPRRALSLEEDDRAFRTIPRSRTSWSRFDLDVTPLFKENPGSLFRIVLSFNRGNSTYPCAGLGQARRRRAAAQEHGRRRLRPVFELGLLRRRLRLQRGGLDQPEQSLLATPTTSPVTIERPSPAAISLPPTSDSWPSSRRAATLHVVTTDIGTARPLSGLHVRAYNYQNQLLGETTSDANGFAVFALKDRRLLRLGRGRRRHRLSPRRGEGALRPEPFRRRRRGHREGRQGHPLRRARRLAAGRHAPPDLRPLRPREGPAGRPSRRPGALNRRRDSSSRRSSRKRRWSPSTPSASRPTTPRRPATGRPASSSAA